MKYVGTRKEAAQALMKKYNIGKGQLTFIDQMVMVTDDLWYVQEIDSFVSRHSFTKTIDRKVFGIPDYEKTTVTTKMMGAYEFDTAFRHYTFNIYGEKNKKSFVERFTRENISKEINRKQNVEWIPIGSENFCPPETLNTFSPFPYYQEKQRLPTYEADKNHFTLHIQNLLTSPVDVQFVTKWLAFFRQNPSRKASLLCLFGPGGTGKSSLSNIAEKLCGSDLTVQFSKMSKLFPENNKNAFLFQKYLIKMEEISPAQVDKYEEELKDFLTAIRLSYLDHYIKPFMASAHHKGILTTEKDMLKAGRKFGCIPVSTYFRGKKQYWIDFYQKINNEASGYIQNVCRYLDEEVDISDFDPLEPPESETLDEIKTTTFDYRRLEFLQWLKFKHYQKTTDAVFIPNESINTKWREFDQLPESAPPVNQRFAHEMVTKLIGPELGKDIMPEKSIVPGNRGYTYNLIEISQRVEAWKKNKCKKVWVPEAAPTECMIDDVPTAQPVVVKSLLVNDNSSQKQPLPRHDLEFVVWDEDE